MLTQAKQQHMKKNVGAEFRRRWMELRKLRWEDG
jgi:hypothetical protein